MSKRKGRDLDDDDDDRDVGGEDSADDRRIEATRKRASARAPKEPKEDSSDDEDRADTRSSTTKEEGAEEIVVGDEDEDDEEEVPRSPRRERRANRYREMQERAAAAEEKAERAEQAARAAQAQVNQFQQSARPAGPPQPSPIDREVEETYQSRVQLTQAYEAHRAAKTLTPEIHKQISERARELESKQYRLEARREILANQPRPVDPMVAHIQATNHDVLVNPQAAKYAQGEFQRRLALNPGGDPYKLMTESFTEARKAFRIAGSGTTATSRAPSAPSTQASRYAAQPRGGGGGGDSGGGRVVKMTEARKRMAEAMFEHEPDVSKRHRLWAKKVGTRLKD